MSSSQKLKQITLIRNRIIQIINSDNEIKRIMYYLTSTPLEKQGRNVDGKIIWQPDISDIDFIKEEKRIHHTFSSKILDKSEVHIFVRRFESNLSDNIIGENKLVIDIVCPVKYSILDENQDRESLIGTKICDLIDGEIIQSLGKIKVIYAKDSIINNNKEFNCLSLFLEIPTSNVKNR